MTRRGKGRRKAQQRGWLRWLLGIGGAVALIVGAAALPIVLSREGETTRRAVIVDQLALTEPNPAFAQDARQALEGAGYEVDYVPGEEVTVDFYRGLPERGYDLIILRIHTARFDPEHLTLDDPVRRQEVLNAFGEDVFLFTSEVYDKAKYAAEREAFQLFAVRYRQGGDERYFGVTPEFVKSMHGDFDGATVLLMGCDGLLFENTPRALVDKGAKAVIGWDGLVSGAHTDEATAELLRLLVSDGMTLGQAVQRTMADVGPDPAYGNALQTYPESVAVETLR